MWEEGGVSFLFGVLSCLICFVIIFTVFSITLAPYCCSSFASIILMLSSTDSSWYVCVHFYALRMLRLGSHWSSVVFIGFRYYDIMASIIRNTRENYYYIVAAPTTIDYYDTVITILF